MRYKLLGKSGLRVSELCLGTMTFGEDWGWGASKEMSQKVFDRFVDVGGNFIDTANLYTEGTSEKYVGEFVASDRDYFVIATKYSLIPPGGKRHDPNFGGNNRKNMMQSVEASLKRLNTDYIDLYYLHAWDFTTPIEEVIRAADDLVRAGKIRYFAFSDTPAWIVSYAVAIAEAQGWTRPVALQVPYSLVRRDLERDVIPMANAMDIAIVPWGILGAGALTGKHNREPESDEPRRVQTAAEDYLAMGEVLIAMAEDIGRTPSQVAINWIRQQSGIIIPILGARTEEQINDNLGVLDFELTDEQLGQLNDASNFTPGFPASFLHSENVQNLLFAESSTKIDNHRLR